MVKIVSPISQRQVEAVPIDFESKSEPWQTIEAEDGSTHKIRTIVTGISRLDGEFDQQGHPLYVVQSNTIIRVVKARIRGDPTITGPSQQPARRGPEVG